MAKHQRTGAPPLYAIRRQMLCGQHGPQLEGIRPAHEVDQAPELLPLEGSRAPAAPPLPPSAGGAGPSRTYEAPQYAPTATEVQ